MDKSITQVTGTLDTVNYLLNTSKEPLIRAYESGYTRIKTDDIVRMKGYIKTIKSSIRDVEIVLKGYQDIAPLEVKANTVQ